MEKKNEVYVDTVVCSHCGKAVTRSETLCDFRIRNEKGEYCRFCKECGHVLDEAITEVEDVIGLVFPEGTLCDLGTRDPFFRIRLQKKGSEAPQWVIVPPNDNTGGLLVFIRRIGNLIEMDKEKRFHILKTKVKITKKTEKVAFAEPF